MALSNGICKYLNQETNLCTIYNNRPIFCNVDAFYEKYLKNKMPINEFYAKNKSECKKLQALMVPLYVLLQQVVNLKLLKHFFRIRAST